MSQSADEDARQHASDTSSGDQPTDDEGHAGLPAAEDLDQATLDKLEEERRERLDPDNRPENVAVDNTQRTFDPDPEVANFTDAENYDGDLDEAVADEPTAPHANDTDSGTEA